MSTGIDMRATTKTRIQRRVEKKQTILLVALVLVVTVVSFVLGVIVGRHTVEPVAVQQMSEPQRIVVAADNSTSAKALPEVPASPVEEKLSFYDNLSKGEVAPIGSGINLPPDPEPTKVEAEPSTTESTQKLKAEAIVAATPPVSKATPLPAPPIRAVSLAQDRLPDVSKGGGWVVQVFSSKSAADAGLLRDKLGSKGYPAYIAEADLGAKGIWYRVLFGPYADKDAAEQAQNYASQKDDLKSIARRR